ncbi:MAG: phosphate/phosphite/phosphonate ABC transporter substrate-binding protein [Deltaproteobacteria bacterium]|nr:phosphate/phosphite/phosphonate ABC transporter substrate-binding protein [Deltaproteobacteria bacterium]
MLDLNQAPNRKALIGAIEKGMDGFADAHDSDYDIVRVLMESLRRGKGRFSLHRGGHNIVVEPLYYDADLFRRLKPFLTKLRLDTGWNYHLRIPPDIATFLKISKEGKGDLYLQESGLERRYSQPQNEPLGSLTLIPPAMNIGVIITAASGNIKKLLDLKGKKIGVPSRLAEGGYMAQTRWLQKHGIPADTMRFVPLRTCERVLMSVYRGDVAAGFLTLDTLHRLQKDLQPNRIVILGESRPLGNWLISARKNIPGFVKDKIRKILVDKSLYSPKDGPP